MTVTNKFVIPFLLFCLLSSYLALCKNLSLRSRTLHFSLRSKSSAKVLAQKPALAVSEATPAATESVSVQVLEPPTVHILPDSPFYFLKTIKEKVQFLITRNVSSQADLLLDFSQKRLAEAVKMAEKGKIYISEKLLAAFGEDIKAAQEKIKQAQERGEQTRDLFLKLQETVAYQKSVLEKIPELSSFLVRIDESLKEATESAKISPLPVGSGLGVFEWLKNLFSRKEILSPLAE